MKWRREPNEVIYNTVIRKMRISTNSLVLNAANNPLLIVPLN